MKITLSLVILFIVLIIGFYRNELLLNKKLLILTLVGHMIILALIFEKKENTEHMTNEAISNCASLFNGGINGIGKVQNLEVTGELKMANGWKISTADSHIRFYKDNQLKGTIDAYGNIVAVTNLMANDGAKTAFYNGDGDLKIKEWNINTNDGHMRFYHNGDQKYVFHNNGAFWNKEHGWFNEVIKDLRENWIKQGDQVKVCLKSNPGQCLHPDSERTSRAGVNIWDYWGSASEKFMLNKV